MAGNDIVQDVFQLDLKINGLVAWGKRNGDSKLSSLRALEKSEVIAYSTLQSAMKASQLEIKKPLLLPMDLTSRGANGLIQTQGAPRPSISAVIESRPFSKTFTLARHRACF
jgi:hypothetical protein